MNDMTREELEEAIITHANGQTAKLLKWIVAMVIGGLGSIFAGGVVWNQLNSTVTYHDSALSDLKPKVYHLETWKERMDATRVTPQEAAALDKRLQRVEDQGQRLENQNTTIMDTLRKIDAKL